MIYEFFSKPLLGFARGWWALGVIAAILALWLALAALERADDKANVEAGRAIEREGAQAEVIKRTEEGNAARQEIEGAMRRGGGDRGVYDQCVRTARTPENCQRFLPE